MGFVKSKNNLGDCLTKLLSGLKKRILCGKFIY